MKTIYLVTGAAGFMGTNVCAQLLERGDAVRAFVLKGDPAVKFVPNQTGLHHIVHSPQSLFHQAVVQVYIAFFFGTSMACPHVAGVAAMIFGIDPTFTAKEVKDIIISTATGSYGSVKEQYPLLNARLAVEKAIKQAWLCPAVLEA